MKNNRALNNDERITKAKKMFEELGWAVKWIEDDEILEIHHKGLKQYIYLYLKFGEIAILNDDDDNKNKVFSLRISDLKALNTLLFDLGVYQKCTI